LSSIISKQQGSEAYLITIIALLFNMWPEANFDNVMSYSVM